MRKMKLTSGSKVMACENGHTCPDGPGGACCGEWGDPPDTPEQRALIAQMNEEARALGLTVVEDPFSLDTREPQSAPPK